MPDYTIIIQSSSDTANKVYNIYPEPPSVSGGGVIKAHAVMWYKSRPLPVGAKDTFRYSSEHFAFIGYTSGFSNKLKIGDRVDGEGSILAAIGTVRDTSSVMLVDKNFAITELNRSFSKDSMQILTENGIPTPNHYVTGLGRKSGGRDPVPVAVVELKPNVDYTFTPTSAVFVRAEKAVDAGQIHQPSVEADITANKAVKVDFKKPYTVATVIEKPDGTFETPEYS